MTQEFLAILFRPNFLFQLAPVLCFLAFGRRKSGFASTCLALLLSGSGFWERSLVLSQRGLLVLGCSESAESKGNTLTHSQRHTPAGLSIDKTEMEAGKDQLQADQLGRLVTMNVTAVVLEGPLWGS